MRLLFLDTLLNNNFFLQYSLGTNEIDHAIVYRTYNDGIMRYRRYGTVRYGLAEKETRTNNVGRTSVCLVVYPSDCTVLNKLIGHGMVPYNSNDCTGATNEFYYCAWGSPLTFI